MWKLWNDCKRYGFSLSHLNAVVLEHALWAFMSFIVLLSNTSKTITEYLDTAVTFSVLLQKNPQTNAHA